MANTNITETFHEYDDEALAAENPYGLSRTITKYGQKYAREKPTGLPFLLD